MTDKDMYLMIESSIRGGISVISNRYSKANNPLLPDFDPEQPTTYIIYLDANNLYGHAQSDPLPVGDFRFLMPDEITQLDIRTIPENSPTGYIIQCDLRYPENLYPSHRLPTGAGSSSGDKGNAKFFRSTTDTRHLETHVEAHTESAGQEELRYPLPKFAVLSESLS